MNQPLVSAVLCTFNRAPLLRQALGALCGQTLGAEQFEVIVVDDGSSDDTRQVVQAFEPMLPLRYFYQANSGLAAAKNHGVAVARAPVVVFLDDDDVLASECLEQHYRTHLEYPDPNFAVLGYTGLAPQVAQWPLMHFVTEVGCHLFSYPGLSDGEQLDFTYFWGGRSSCKRGLLMEHGVFNPVFRFGCEDIELGYRLSKKAGLRVVYNSRAVSTMVRTLDFDGFCRRSWLQGGSNRRFADMHPDEVIRTWAEVDGIVAEWRAIEPRYEQIIKAGRDLDRLAVERVRAGLPVDEFTTRLLHRAYHAAFRASRIKGSVERMQQDERAAPESASADAG